MAMTLRLSDNDQQALKARAEVEGISMQEAARRAIRDYVARSEHRSRVTVAADLIVDAHADAIDRLGR
jgi:predicted transcriptional regulator